MELGVPWSGYPRQAFVLDFRPTLETPVEKQAIYRKFEEWKQKGKLKTEAEEKELFTVAKCVEYYKNILIHFIQQLKGR
jgi:hypothetical protein